MNDVDERAAEIGGSCVCGTVQWAIRGPFRFFQYCHCSRCRKRSGSLHAANIAIPVEQYRLIDGETAIVRYELPDAKSWSNCFCARCGSGVPWVTRNGKGVIVPAGGLDEDPGARPTRNIHFASRATWHVHSKDLPFFDEEPPKT